MKVCNIINEMEPAGSFNISDDDMDIIFHAMKNKPELHVRDIKELAHEIADETEYSRSAGSAQFVIQRMHVIMHGLAPHGVTEQTAEAWMTPARPLLTFMAEKGYEPEERIRRAKIELGNRKAKISQEQATQMMAQGAKALSPEQRKFITQQRGYRENIIADIMTGLTAEEAFNKILH